MLKGEDESALQLYHRVLEVLEGQYGAHDPALVGVLVSMCILICCCFVALPCCVSDGCGAEGWV